MNNYKKQLRHMLATLSLSAVLVACNPLPSTLTGGGGDGGDPAPERSTVRLFAFSDFRCTANWTDRDGALGLKVGSRSGTCSATFNGEPGIYRMALAAQTEREGQSPYRISINGRVASAGRMPFSQGRMICDCKQPWQTYCPDVVVELDAGLHDLKKGDVLEFYGEEEYLCGKHGAYSKWHGLIFMPHTP